MMDDSAVPPLARCLASEASHLTELWLGGNELTDDAAGDASSRLRSRGGGGHFSPTEALARSHRCADPTCTSGAIRPPLSSVRSTSFAIPDSVAMLSG